jgi:broad specificity phosphatase PhoE
MLGEPALYIVRHGETELNAGNKFRGFMDVELDENGRDQARELRDYLANIPFTAAYSSDLKRAAETANIITRKQMKVEQLAGARPWHVGVFAGKTKNEVNKRALASYAATPEVAIPNGESLDEFRKRFKQVFDGRVADAMDKGGPVLLVAHASNVHEVGNILDGDINKYDVDPGGLIAVYITRDGLKGKIIRGAAEGKDVTS